MGRGRCFEGQFAAETMTRPAKEKKSGAFTLSFQPFFVFVCPRLPVVAGQIARIEAARGRSRGIGRMKIGHSEALVPGRKRRAVGAPKYSHSLCLKNKRNSI
jgi:hypothetical protein